MSSGRYRFKVLSGVHLGAEVEFGSEGLLVGREDYCDVVLDDESLAQKHVRLNVVNGGVQLAELGGSVRRADEELTNGFVLNPFEVLLAGDVRFAIGPADEVWPALIFPEVKAKPSHSEAASVKLEGAAAEAANAHSGKPHAVKLWMAGVLLVSVLLVAVVFLLMSPGGSDELSAEPRDSIALALMEKRTTELQGQHDLKFSWRDDRMHVSGRMEYEHELNALRQHARTHRIPVRYEVACWDIAIDQARNIIHLYRMDWEIEPIGLTGMRIAGFTEDVAQKRRVLADIRNAIGQIDPFENAIVTLAEVRLPVQNMINRRGMQHLLFLEVQEDRLALIGSLPGELSAEWEVLYREIYETLPKVMIDTSEVKIVSSSEFQTTLFGASVAAVHLGEVEYIMLSNSLILMEGARTPTGWFLEEVSADKLVVRNGNFSLDLTLTL